MGEKRASIRQLADGSRVKHHPPTPDHPQGKQELIREGSALKDRLDANLEENRRRHEQLKTKHIDRIEAKRAVQQEKGLPGEKTSF